MLATADNPGAPARSDKSNEELSEEFYGDLRTPEDVAAIIRVNRATVYRYLKDNTLPRTELFGRTYVSVADLLKHKEAAIERARQEAARKGKKTPRPRQS